MKRVRLADRFSAALRQVSATSDGPHSSQRSSPGADRRDRDCAARASPQDQ